MNWQPIVIASSVVLGVSGFLGWRLRASTTSTVVPNTIVLHDPSASKRDGCAATLGLVSSVLKSDALVPGSTLIVLSAGDRESANEPVELGRFDEIVGRRAMEGPRTAARRNQALLTTLAEACTTRGELDRSPIFLALHRAIEQLRASGCGEGTGCALLVQTDGEETAEPAIVAALDGKRTRTKLPSPIDNRGIRVRLCGLAETNGHWDRRQQLSRPRDIQRIERVRSVWTGLFTEPALVVLEPHCPKLQPSETKGRAQ